MRLIKIILPALLMLNSGLPAAQTLSVIPVPAEVKIKKGVFKLGPETVVRSDERNQFNRTYLLSKLRAAGVTDKRTGNSGVIELITDNTIPQEGYSLISDSLRVTIKASSKAGFFYGIQTLLQMLPPTVYSGVANGFEKWEVPAVEINDYPRYGYRGMMLDVSRTFFDKATIINYMDWLSYHKINKFHWHLTDDNGWRIEIKKYPLLTSRGAWRGPGEALAPTFGSGNKRYGGFFSQKDVKEIVKYAAERNIEIIPEIDLPGHSKAVTATYPEVLCESKKDAGESVQGEVSNVWCVSNEKNYKMLDNIIKELASMFPGKYIHIGGDEVNMSSWEHCESCSDFMKSHNMKKPSELQNYFVRRLEKIVEKYGKTMAGWDEILEGGDLHKSTAVYAWRSVDKGVESITKGQPTIFMPGPYCYLDMKQSPLERGHNWAGIVTLEKTYSLDPEQNLTGDNKNLILGVQGGLWTELLAWPPRFIEYQTFPRMAAIAEIGWSKRANMSWESFHERITKYHFDRMSQMGIAFRVEPPVATYENGIVYATASYPWAVIRYSDNESNPDSHSPVYCGPISTADPLKYRFAVFYNDFTRSIPVKVQNVDYVYQTPATVVTSNIVANEKSSVNNVSDYKYDTYFRSAAKAKAGDYVLYTFQEPVESKRITVESGIPVIDFYWVTDGYVEYSVNGTDFIKVGELNRGKITFTPAEKIKAVKIVITAPNDANTIVFQDLKIE